MLLSYSGVFRGFSSLGLSYCTDTNTMKRVIPEIIILLTFVVVNKKVDKSKPPI